MPPSPLSRISRVLSSSSSSSSSGLLPSFSTEELTAQFYFAGWEFVKKLDQKTAERLFYSGADLASLGGRRPEQLRKNLARVVHCTPEEVPNELVRDSMRAYARYWMEAFRLPTIAHSGNVKEFVDEFEKHIEGVENISRSMEQGKGMILTLPHSGNWDVAGLWLAQKYNSFATVAERLKPEELFDAFVEYRESLGFQVFPLTGGAKKPMEELRGVLANGGIVALLGDRDLSRHGVEVTFFNERTSMPAGPAKLAQEMGCPLHAVHVWFTPDGWAASVSSPIDTDREVPEIVQDVAHHFERSIARHPEDWHMLQPLWFQDLSPERMMRRLAAKAEETAKAQEAEKPEESSKPEKPERDQQAGS